MRTLLFALALFLGCEVQALDQRCAGISAEQLIACLQGCPDAQRGVACRRNCLYQRSKAKSACNAPPVFSGPLVISNLCFVTGYRLRPVSSQRVYLSAESNHG